MDKSHSIHVLVFCLPVLAALANACAIEQCPATTHEVDGRCVRNDQAAANEGKADSTGQRPSSKPSGGDGEPDASAALADGRGCTTDTECESGHCSSGICCQGGECCNTPEDCVRAGEPVATCEQENECQGARGKAGCLDFRCQVREGGVDDDSACDVRIEADDCGPYLSAFCTGEVDQRKPECPDSCQDDTGCDPEAHCANGKCVDDECPPEKTRNCGGTCVEDGADACCDDSDCDPCNSCEANQCTPTANGQPGAGCMGECEECRDGMCADKTGSCGTGATCAGQRSKAEDMCVDGECQPGATGDCSPYGCASATACATSCRAGTCGPSCAVCTLAQVCDGTACRACGGTDQPCCAASRCGTGLECSAGACRPNCGGIGEACCANSTCSNGALNCVNGRCEDCGGEGQVCCGAQLTGTCDAVALVCFGGICERCDRGGPCCAGRTCPSGMYCLQYTEETFICDLCPRDGPCPPP
jgi:hypothetical protein